MTHITKVVLMSLNLLVANNYHNKACKDDIGYFIQELGNYSHDHYLLFTGFHATMSVNNDYYVISEDQLKKSIANDTLNLMELTMIIEPHPDVYILSESNKYEPLLINYTSGISALLSLDDTGVYKIGTKFYVLRKAKYKYTDGIKLKWKDEDNELREYKSEKLRLFLYTKELLPIPKSIQKHVWKKKYEFPDFWHDYVRNTLTN